MKKTPIASARPGEIVTRPVVNANSVTLLQAGARLTAENIARLAALGIDTVWVEGDAPGALTPAQAAAELDRRFAGHETDPLMMDLKGIVASLMGRKAEGGS